MAEKCPMHLFKKDGCPELDVLPDAWPRGPGFPFQREGADGGNLGTTTLTQARGEMYGPTDNNFLCAGLLRRVYRNAVEGQHPDPRERTSHDHAIEMVLTKIARVATGKFHPDNYKDAIGYLELAHELAKKGEKVAHQ